MGKSPFMSTAEDFAKTLKDLGVFLPFKRRKQELVKQGYSSAAAYIQARHEIERRLNGFDHSSGDSDDDPGDPTPDSAPDSVGAGISPPIFVGDSTSDPDKPKSEPEPEKTKMVIRKLDIYEELAEAAIDKKAGERETSNWVFNHIKIAPEKIDPAEVPSAGAAGLLEWAKKKGQSEFYRTVWSKQISSKSELERASQNELGDKRVDELDDELMRTIESGGDYLASYANAEEDRVTA